MKRSRTENLEMEHYKQMMDAWQKNVNENEKYKWCSNFPYLHSPEMDREYDYMGDQLDECGDGLCTELKSIALWGGKVQYKASLLAYNDLRCAESILQSDVVLYDQGKCQPTTQDVISFAKLISKNRFGILALGIAGTDVAVTQSERVHNAMKRYTENPNMLLKYPPKKIVSKLWSKMQQQNALEETPIGHDTSDVIDHTVINRTTLNDAATESSFVGKCKHGQNSDDKQSCTLCEHTINLNQILKNYQAEIGSYLKENTSLTNESFCTSKHEECS